MRSAPRILVTVAVPGGRAEPDVQQRKNALYADAVRRHGGEPRVVDATTPPDGRRAALQTMAGLLLTGGVDLDPALYGRPNEGSVDVEPERDALEAEAWQEAASRGLPALGICRGFQALNVFLGGTLLQHVDGHRGPAYGAGPALQHPLRVVPGTRLARILFPTNLRGGVLRVNSYHHQGIRPGDLAADLVASGWAPSPAGDLVEAFEGRGDQFLVGVQTHPERTESTPAAFDRLWRVFVDACRGALTDRR